MKKLEMKKKLDGCLSDRPFQCISLIANIFFQAAENTFELVGVAC